MITTSEKENQLDQLKRLTTVVADTGDFEELKAYRPQDATTNPSLILAASQREENRYLVDQAIAEHQGRSLNEADLLESIIDRVLILFGLKILEVVHGRVSTETDARLSFDTAGSVAKGRQLISLYAAEGMDS